MKMKFSIKSKVLLSFFLLVIVCITVICLYFSVSLSNDEYEKTRVSYLSECKKMAEELEGIVSSVQKCGNYIRYDDFIIELIKDKKQIGEYDIYLNTDRFLKRYRSVYDMILLTNQINFRKVFFVNSAAAISEKLLDDAGSNFLTSEVHDVIYTTNNVKNEQWYKETIELNGTVNVFFVPDSATICISQLIKNGDTNIEEDNFIGVSLVKFDIRELIDNYNYPEFDTEIAVRFEDEIIASTTQDTNSFYAEGNDLTVFETVCDVDFILLINKLRIDTKQIVGILIPCVIIMIIVGVLLSYWLTRSMTKPILTLSKRIANGLDDEDYPVTDREDEVGLLYKAYSEMKAAIKDYTIKLKKEEEERRRTEFKLYQYRITPHMLYNTLDSISWLAMEDGNEKIVRMNKILSDLYRYNVKNDSFTTEITEELEFVSKYVELQRMRYDGTIKFEISCDKECEKILIPCCIIQPFVENSIIHNFNAVKNINVRISVKRIKEYITIEIDDNGVCDNIEELINKRICGIGINNVIERIKFKYNSESGVDFCKSELGGVKVVIRLLNI